MPCLLVSARQWSFSLPTDSRKKVSCTLTDIFIHGLRWHKKNVSPRPYTLSAQPYDFEPHWLIPNFFVAHFHFWQFHALVSRILLRSSCSKSLINGQSLYTRYCGKALLPNSTFTLLVSQQVFWHRDQNFITAFSCYLYLTQSVHLTHIFPIFMFFSKLFPSRGMLKRTSMIQNLECPLLKP